METKGITCRIPLALHQRVSEDIRQEGSTMNRFIEKVIQCYYEKEPPMAEQTPDSIITTQRNGQTIVAELFFNHSSTETFRDKLLKLVLADSSRLSASDGQEPEKTEILR